MSRAFDPRTALVRAPAAPAELLISRAHVLDPRAGIDAVHDVLVRDGAIAEIGAPGSIEPPPGAEVVEVAHCFLERPDEPAVALYDSGDAERLERELLGLAQGVVEGRFEPSSEPHFSLCADCPGRAALCVHEEALTLGLSVGTPS